MQALRKCATQIGADYTDTISAPAVGEQDVCIRVHAAGLCGSDIHAYQWTRGYEFMALHLPLTLGHEFSGIAEQVPAGQSKIKQGDKVTIWPTRHCTTCPACLNNQPQYCQSRTIIGLHCDGGFADYAAVPLENCFPLPDDMPFELGALTEPVSIAVHAVKTADITSGQHLVVFGPGPIGLFTALYAQSRGAKVVLVGYHDQSRLNLAQEMGIQLVCDSADISLPEFLNTHFTGHVDRVIEAAGSVACLEQAMEILSAGGILVIAGIHTAHFSIDVTPLVRRKQQIRGAHDTTEASFTEAIRFIDSHRDVFAKSVTHVFPLSEGEMAFATALEKRAMKVMFRP